MFNLIKILVLALAFTSVSHGKSEKISAKLVYHNSCTAKIRLSPDSKKKICDCTLERLVGKELNFSDAKLLHVSVPQKRLTDKEAGLAFENDAQIASDANYEIEDTVLESCIEIVRNQKAAPMEDEE